jgi:hypothetical protein
MDWLRRDRGGKETAGLLARSEKETRMWEKASVVIKAEKCIVQMQDGCGWCFIIHI